MNAPLTVSERVRLHKHRQRHGLHPYQIEVSNRSLEWLLNAGLLTVDEMADARNVSVALSRLCGLWTIQERSPLPPGVAPETKPPCLGAKTQDRAIRR